MEDKEIISKNLIYLRKQKGKTQQEIADEFSYTFQAISRWETGKSIPDVITLKKIAEYYNVDINYFFIVHDETKLTNEEKIKLKKKTISQKIGLLLMAFFIIAGLAYYIISVIPQFKITKLSIIAASFFMIALAFSYIFNIRRHRYLLYSLIIWSIIIGIYLIFKDKIINLELIIIYGFFIQIFIFIVQIYNKKR